MKSLGWLTTLTVLILVGAIRLLHAVAGNELIDRRDQARGAFLATPQGVYQHYCAHCHGDDATGGGRLWATELSPSPADLTALKADKQYVLAVIRDGSTAHGKSKLCPPWRQTISPADAERLAQYIISLGGKTPPLPSQPPTLPETAGEPFPWFLVAALIGEIVLLWQMQRRRKEVTNRVPQYPLMPG